MPASVFTRRSFAAESGKLPVSGLPEIFRFSLDDGDLMGQLCEITLEKTGGDYSCNAEWKAARPVPAEVNWFENVWNEYMKGENIR